MIVGTDNKGRRVAGPVNRVSHRARFIDRVDRILFHAFSAFFEPRFAIKLDEIEGNVYVRAILPSKERKEETASVVIGECVKLYFD